MMLCIAALIVGLVVGYITGWLVRDESTRPLIAPGEAFGTGVPGVAFGKDSANESPQ